MNKIAKLLAFLCFLGMSSFLTAQESFALDLYDKNFIHVKFRFFSGIELSQGDETTGVMFGIDSRFGDRLFQRDDSKDSFSAYKLKNTLGIVLFCAGIIVSSYELYNQFKLIGTGYGDNFPDPKISQLILAGGIVVNVAGGLLIQASVEDLVRSVNQYNRALLKSQ